MWKIWIVQGARRSTGAIKAIRRNLRNFDGTTAPANGGGRARSLTLAMLDALLEYLLRKPEQKLTGQVLPPLSCWY